MALLQQSAVGVPHNASNPRFALLDVLRIDLAVLVFMFHSNMHFECSYGILNDMVKVGAFAMTGFFLLSGYSLRIVYGEKNLMAKIELKSFYLKRMFGILPLYYAYAVLFLLIIRQESVIENLLLLPIEGLGLQSTFTSLFGVTHNGGTWFISCLLMGYLLYPFLQTLVTYITTRQKAILMVILIGIELWAVVTRIVFSTCWLYDNPFYRILEFTIGLIAADINLTAEGKFISLLRSYGLLIGTAVLMTVSVSLIEHIHSISDYMLLNWIVLPGFVIMLFSLGIKRVACLEKSMLIRYASSISYPFFLTQLFLWKLAKWCIKLIGYDSNLLRITISFSICVLVSVVMYEIVQKRLVCFIKSRITPPAEITDYQPYRPSRIEHLVVYPFLKSLLFVIVPYAFFSHHTAIQQGSLCSKGHTECPCADFHRL